MGIRVNVDGRMGTERDRLLSPLDLGFVFGASVYETLRTYGGRPFMLGRHLTRLRESAASLKINLALTDEAFAALSTANAERLFVRLGNGDDPV